LLCSDNYLKDFIHLYARLSESNENQSIQSILLSELHLLTNDSFCIFTDEQLQVKVVWLVLSFKMY